MVRRIQRRHDGNIRRADSGQELAIFFGIDITDISHFAVSLYRTFVPDEEHPDKKIPINILAVNCRAVFDKAVGFEVKSVDIAKIEYSEPHGAYSFSPIVDSPLEGDQIWALLEMHRELDEILLEPSATALLVDQ